MNKSSGINEMILIMGAVLLLWVYVGLLVVYFININTTTDINYLCEKCCDVNNPNWDMVECDKYNFNDLVCGG